MRISFSIDKGRAPYLHCRLGRLRIMWWDDAASRKLAAKRPVLRPGRARGVRWVFEFRGVEALWAK